MSDLKKEVGLRLKQARERKGYKQNRVAKTIGIHNSTLAKYESGEREADNETLSKLAEMYGVSPTWLLTGKNDQKIVFPEDYRLVPIDPDNMVRLPVLGTIRSDEPIYMNESTERYEYVSPDVLRGRKGFILKVKDDSMIGDRICEGDMVVCVSQEECEPSDIAVVAINGEEATLKRVKCQGENCVLTSSNPIYEPMIYKQSEVHILGIVEMVMFRMRR